MPNLIKRHVYVTFPGVGEIEVFPKNETIRYGWQKDNDVWRKKVDTKLWFINEDPGPKTFDIFASLELEECGCHRLDMRITLECEGGVETDLFKGVLIFIDGEWFFDFCSVEIKPRVNDPFECLFKNWETDVNILEGSGDPVTLTTDTGNFEVSIPCNVDYFGDTVEEHIDVYEEGCLSGYDGNDWSVARHNVFQSSGLVVVFTIWIREVFSGAGPPPGAGWTMVNPTFWTRPVVRQGPTIVYTEGEEYDEQWSIISRTLDNGRLLSEVLINLFSACSDYPLRSDFLGIDPDGEAPANDAYIYAQTWLWNAVLFQMGDVVRLNAFENSTKAIVNLSNLLRCLRRKFKAFLYFDEDNQVYRIEHISFVRFSRLINLVTMRPDALRGYTTYTYEKVRIPQKEVFKYSYPTNDEDWDNASILYADCNDVGRVEEYEIDCFHTDFGSLVGSGIEDIDVLKGLVLVSQLDGQINRAVGDISGILKMNGGLSWANVVRELWRWRMPSCEALVNGVQTTFLSLIPKIKQTTFSAELCCMDVLALNPAIDRVRTQLGNGEFADNVELDLSTGLTEFSLLFAPPITLIDLSVSISVDDDTQCYFTDFIFQTNENFPSGVTITWDFGSGAVPPTATGEGPHAVQYTTVGAKTITVTAAFGGEEVMATTTVTVQNCPANIVGKVYDTDGFPFSGANVRLYNDANQDGVSDGGIAVRSVFTTSLGNIAMASLTPGYYVQQCIIPAAWLLDHDIHTDIGTHPGNNLPNYYSIDAFIPIRLEPSELDSGGTYYLKPRPGIIRGSVKDNLGAAIVGAQVDIHADDNLDGVADGASLYSTVTDASGNYEFLNIPVEGGGHTGSTANTAYKNYVIILTVPMGYTIVSGIDVSGDSDLVANTPTTDNIIPCTLTPNETDAGNDFIIM